MEEFIEKIITEPFLARFIFVIVGVILLIAVTSLIKKQLHNFVKDQNNWYRARKLAVG